MTWSFIWLMFVLKIQIIGLFTIVWWAIKQTDEPASEETVKAPPRPRPHPRLPARRPRPRGPHGAPAALPAPPRVRPTAAIAARIGTRVHHSER